MEREVLAAPPLLVGAVEGGGQPAGLAAAPQNTTDPHSETPFIEVVLKSRLAYRPLTF